MQPILPYKGVLPTLENGVFIASGAQVMGDVVIGEQSNIWFNCVVRGDVNIIRIGSRTNIQDGTVVHVTRKTSPTHIGSGVTVGHTAILHGCEVQDNAFIGMGAIVMDDAVVEEGGMVAAGAMVTPGKIIRAGELWAGRPAKLFRMMTEEEKAFIAISAENYVRLAAEYLAEAQA